MPKQTFTIQVLRILSMFIVFAILVTDVTVSIYNAIKIQFHT